MKSELLTIAIPTYNRPQLLEITLQELINQCKSYNLPIVISDNSDNYETVKVVNKFSDIYEYIKYSKNETNIGLDRNFLRVVDLADTEYVWIFGDDDLPENKAIDSMVNRLVQNENVDFFIVNSAPYTSDLSQPTSDAIVNISFDKYYDTCDSALVDISWYTTFVGSFVFKRHAWKNINPSIYLDTVFVHCGILFESMAKNNSKAQFLSAPLIKYRTANASWSANTIKIFFELWPSMIRKLPDSISESAKRQAVVKMVEKFFTLQLVCALRAANKFQIRDALSCSKVFLKNSRFSFKSIFFIMRTFMVVLVPVSIISSVQKLYRSFPKHV